MKIGQEVYDARTNDSGKLISSRRDRSFVVRFASGDRVVPREFISLTYPADSVRLANCAQCNMELLGGQNPERDKLPPKYRYLPEVAGRLGGGNRPYCEYCFSQRRAGNQRL